jgi:hypothetical protein
VTGAAVTAGPTARPTSSDPRGGDDTTLDSPTPGLAAGARPRDATAPGGPARRTADAETAGPTRRTADAAIAGPMRPIAEAALAGPCAGR